MTTPKEKRNKTKPILLIIGGLIVLCILCIGLSFLYSRTPTFKAKRTTDTAEAVAANATEVARPTDSLIPTSTGTPTKEPTDTPGPTDTPRPTNTPKPTNTPVPTLTPTQPPQPITLSGQGDSVIDADKWEGPAIAHVTYTGGSNFIVTNYDPDGNTIDLLINEIGSYEGTIPIDFLGDQNTARFEIKASGPWEIILYPIAPDYIRKEIVPTNIEGTGDEIVFLGGAVPDLAKIDASTANSNFIVYAYAGSVDLLVNEIAPYAGTVIMDADTFILVIRATGPWKIEITAK